MASQLVYRYTLDEYLEKEETLGYRTEFHDSAIFPVELATITHALLEERIGMILAKANPSCSIYGSSLNLYIESANKILHADYLLISQTEPMVGLYSRREDGWFYVERRRDESLNFSMAELVEIQVADIYGDILT